MKTPTIHQASLCVCLWAVCFTNQANGQDGLLKENGCLYSVDGNCVPRRTTYGYYQTHWRTWPYAQPPSIPKMQRNVKHEPQGSTALPAAEVPKVREEAAFSPDLPTAPEELAPTGVAPSEETDPFQNDLKNQPMDSPFDSPRVEPEVETPFEDDLNFSPTSSSGAVRLDRPGISQTPRRAKTPTSGASHGYRNPLRRETFKSQAVPAHFMQFDPSTRPATHEAPIRERRAVVNSQPVLASPIVSSGSNPLRR